MPPTGIVPLDELRLFVVVDNETDMLSSVDPGIPQTPEGATLAKGSPVVREWEGHACHTVIDRTCCACHGFSVLVTGRRDGIEHTLLYDVGPYAEVWLGNAAKHQIDLSKIEAVFLSHWHYDHSGGFPEVIAAISAARKKAGKSGPLPVSLHPDRPDQRGILHPNGTLIVHRNEPTFEAIAAAGGTVEKHADPHALCGGFFYGSGKIDRVTSYELGLAGHHSFRGSQGGPDPLILDERYLAAEVKGRGVTILSACSHAGVVNACLSAQQAFAPAPIDMVLGGYHLAGKEMEARIPATVQDLKTRIQPRFLAPGHCTGWRAKAALAAAFAGESEGQSKYGPSCVGSTYTLKTGSA
jgi:7,8-dihydropterin-6-yl-methyl-4-(beta-D-ribofuranosyl)aminobenzene 5'-phosphate synthase